MSATTSEPLMPSARRGLALALLCSVQFMVVLDASIASVALPSLREDLGMSEGSLQYVLSLYALTFGGFLILAGRAGDLFGRRLFFIIGLALFGLASLVCGLAPSGGVLLAARAAQGLGAAFVSPAALSLITTIFEEGSERNRALGAWGAVSAAGGAAGLILGGVLTDSLGWEWVFFINVPVALGAILSARRLLPESRERGASARLDLPGAVTVTAGLALLIYGLTRGQEDGFDSAVALGLLGGALALLLAFRLIEARVHEPLVPFAIFRLRTLTGANLAALMLSALIAAQSFFGSLYMQGVLGYSAIETGLAFLPVTLVAFVSSSAGSRLTGRFGPRVVIPAGMLVAGAGLLYLARISVNGSFWVDLLPGFTLFGLGLGAAFVAFTIAATAGVSGREQGLASGLINTSQQVGFAVGLAALATVAVSYTEALGGPANPANLVAGYRLGLLAAAVLAALGALVAALVIVPRQDPRQDAEGSPISSPIEATDPAPVSCCWTGTAGRAPRDESARSEDQEQVT